MNNPHEVYLESQVLSAPPQRLRLLLIEGALRFGGQALKQWEANDWDTASETLARCRDIVEELLQSIQAESSPLAKRVSDLYLFLFQSLAEAQIKRDQRRLKEVLGILETECETWRQVCDLASVAPRTGFESDANSFPQLELDTTEAGGFSVDA